MNDIEILENKLKQLCKSGKRIKIEDMKTIYAICETIQNLIQRNKDLEQNLRAEREKKDKIINLMAEMLIKDHEWFYSEFDDYKKQDFIEYFTNKVEESEK